MSRIANFSWPGGPKEISRWSSERRIAPPKMPCAPAATGLSEKSFCLACFDGNYPVQIPDGAGKFVMGKERKSLAPEASPQTELFGKLK